MLVLVSATALGIALCARLRLPMGAATRLGLGLALGQWLVLWPPFLLALCFDLSAAGAALLASLAELGCAAWLGLRRTADREALLELARSLRSGLLAPAQRASVGVGVGLCALLLWLLHTHYLRPCDGGACSAGVTWGDLPIHLALASRFLHAPGLPTLEHPLYLGGQLAYPFLPDYTVALVAAQEVSLRWAFIAAGLLPLVACVLLLHGLTRLWLGDAPRHASALALTLFFFAGGLGAFYVLQPVLAGQPLGQVLGQINASYVAPHALKSGSLGNLLIAARTAAPGMALGLAALWLLGQLVLQRAQGSWQVFALAGALIGGLPLVHGHSFLVSAGVLGWYACVGREHATRWLGCAVTAAALAAPQLLWLAHSGAPSSLRIAFGFLRPAPSGAEWLLDLATGLGAWLVLVPLAFMRADSTARRLSAPLLVLLPLSCFVTFTPTLYDNVKLLAWFDVAAAVLVASMLSRWSARPALLAWLALCTTGLLAVGHELVNEAPVFSAGDERLAELVIAHTAPDAVVATAASYHDPVALLTGRRVPLATPSMLDTHGIAARPRAMQVIALYAGGPAGRAAIDALGVTAVVVGHHERKLPRLDERALAALASEMYEVDGERLYILAPTASR